MQLNDTHLVLLSAATQRDDKLLVRPDTLTQKASDRLAARFIAAGLVEELPVTQHQPHWRTEQDDAPVGLRITKAGFEALGIEPDDGAVVDMTGGEASRSEDQAGDLITANHDSADAQDPAPAATSHDQSEAVVDAEGVAISETKRPGSKRDLLIGLLQRDEGSSIAAITAATGWLPHSSRAALTGLRKSGYVLVKSKDAANATIYRLSAPEASTDAPVDNAAE